MKIKRIIYSNNTNKYQTRIKFIKKSTMKQRYSDQHTVNINLKNY